MAPADGPNGSAPSPSDSESSPPKPRPQNKRAHSVETQENAPATIPSGHSRDDADQAVEGQPTMAPANGVNGVSGVKGFPYHPAALLDPRRAQPGHAVAPSTPGVPNWQQPMPAGNGTAPNDNFFFQFSTPSSGFNESPNMSAFGAVPATSPQAYLSQPFNATPMPTSNGSQAGFGFNGGFTGQRGMVERMAQVEDRSSVPAVKRRKTDAVENGNANGSMSGGSGLLGDYVKEKKEEMQSTPSAAVSQTVDLTAGDDDVEMIDPQDEEVCYGMLQGKLDCHLVPSPKPGAVSLFGPNWVPFVKIILRRLAGDSSTKIDAYDCTRKIIGRVSSAAARGLAPLLDSTWRIRTDSRVPSRQRKGDETPGRPIVREYNLEINLYGPARYTDPVGKHLAKYGLKLMSPSMVNTGIKVRNPHVEQYRAPVPKNYAAIQNQAFSVAAPARTVEEVRAEVMSVFDSLADRQNLPEADAHPAILTPLLKHQRQGLHFLYAREGFGGGEKLEGPSIWKKRTTAAGQKLFYNIITNQMAPTVPEIRGGILADMMGLGKTLSMLSLVVGTLDEASKWSTKQPRQPVAPASKHSKNTARVQSLDLTPLKRNAKSTLLVCPLSTVTNWEEQIKQHILPGSLKYYVYHGANRIKDPEKLADFDLVITTYGSVSSELGARSKGKQGAYPLEEVAWFRIMLDEAHMIREQTTLQFKAICRLQADRRWAVTGTPVQNRLDDLGALLAFIRIRPFDDRTKFQRFIVDPFKLCDPEIVPKLRILVDTVTLRRLKDKIDLPKRTDSVVKLKFSPEERRIYDLFAKNAEDRVKVLAGPAGERGLRGQTYIHILRSILRLRLICAHGKDLLNEEDLQVLQGMTAEMAIDLDSDEEEEEKAAIPERKAYEMLELMQETNNDECVVCSKKLGSNDGASIESEGQEDMLGYINPCFHVFCCSCVQQAMDQYRVNLKEDQKAGYCHICHATNVRFEFFGFKRTKAEVEHDGPAKSKPAAFSGLGSGSGSGKGEYYSGPSTKVKALLADLRESKAESLKKADEPPFKSVVFSAWTSHLDLIQRALETEGISYTRLDGSMTRTARTAAMDAFRDDDNVHVILVSIMAGGLGLNLTSGNNVYVMEPQYNPAAEAQAVDRVHRLGQKREVRTIRYIMEESFEEKMLELQEKKVKLASLSMDGRDKAVDKGEAARQKLLDLRSLFR